MRDVSLIFSEIIFCAPHKNLIVKMVLMKSHKICVYGEIWMDNMILVIFNSISVISGRWKAVCNGSSFMFGKISVSSGARAWDSSA